MAKRKRIALLYGGASNEHDVSVMGYEYMIELISDTEYEILPVYIERDGTWSVTVKDARVYAYPTAMLGGSLYTARGFIKIDVAIPLLHGDGGEDGSVEGALECAGIPYVGAGVCTSAMCLDKTYTKAIAESLGIPTLKSVSPKRGESDIAALEKCKSILNFPMFVKPRRLGSSVGAYPIPNEEEFLKCYPLATRAGDGLVIVEECLGDKRELECAFIEIGKERIVTPPGEVLIDGFYGYSEKYGGKTKTSPRAKLPKDISDTVVDYGNRLADAIGLRHLGRIDFFLSEGKIYFNEINTFPGFTRESLYPKMLECYGIHPRDAILSFVKDALSW